MGSFTALANEDFVLGEEVHLQDEITDQDIEFLMNGAFDPFDDGEDEAKELDHKMALEGIQMLRDDQEEHTDSLIKAIDTNKLVTQAIKKKQLIN